MTPGPPARPLFLFIILLLTVTSVEAERTVRVGVFLAPPLVMVQNGKPQGLFIDLIQEFAKRGHWNLQYIEGTWSVQLAALVKGDLDLLPAIGYAKARESVYDFSREPVFIDSGVLFTGARTTIHTLFDLKGKRVAALDTSIFTEAFRSNMASFGIECQIIPVGDNETVMKAIVSGQADAGVSIYSLGSYLARRYPVSMTPISFSPIALEFGVPKGTNADLLTTIDLAMAAMRTDPDSVYSRSYKKWTLPPETVSFPVWLWWTLAGLVLFGTLLGGWNFSLNRLVADQTGSLVAEKERLSVTLNSIADGVITSDEAERVQLMNPVAERLCGWSQSEASGRNVHAVFVLGGYEPIDEVQTRTLVSRDGSQYRIVESHAPIRTGAGQTLGTVRIFRDVTEREKMLETMQRTDKLEALGFLAGGIAHDFNNLLAGIFGFIELARKSENGIKAAKYLDKAMAVYSRAKGLSHQLLTFSTGGTPVKKPLDLGPLLRSSASFAGAGSNVRVEVELENDLWKCNVDENQLGQVFDNLIINAWQSMPDGGLLRVIARNVDGPQDEYGISASGHFVCLTFADEGMGIPEELRSKIFDPFFTTKTAGHGLGLATCNSIIQKHRGLLDFQSTPGVGTTFRIVLPALADPAESQELLPSEKHRGSGTMIVMDDEEFILDILTQELESLGYQVLVARHGQQLVEALPQALAGPPLRAIFMDLTVPGGLGGREIIASVRSFCPALPIFASSGFSEDPVMANPQDYGFTSSIGKPYRAADLARLLNRYLK